ncbi:MAG TPA: tetratricopeptide repeat protein [Candidatus Binatia bacterium]|nr:tetratricopeptide repeat protein [Candidatus Binatia bacterium]
MGETPNIAARIQGIAEPNTVVISEATSRLVQGLFECQDCGPQELKGVSTPVPVYRVLRESEVHSRFEVAVRTGLTPLVGRDHEVGLLRERWVQARGGAGQVVLLRGEPGIGKSRLVQELKEQVSAAGAARIEFRCSPYHQNSAFYPIIEHLQRLLQFHREEAPYTKVAKLQQALLPYRFPQADVQGYSRLLGEDELTTLRTVASHLDLMRTLVGQHGGRAVGSRGDSLLAEFPSVVQAVQCAVQMQHELKVRNVEVPPAQRVEFRMGINVGEVVVEGEEIYGEGVNIAVRLEGLAAAGGICLSEVVYDQVRNRLALAYEALGEQELKNIQKPVRVWQVQADGSESPKSQVPSPKLHRVGNAHRIWVVVGGLALIMAVVMAVRYLSHPPLSTQDSALRTPAEPASALPLPDKPSIAVLPFTNMSGDPDQEYFNDGMTDTLITDLSKLSGLFVIARHPAFTYKGKPVKVQEVSQELGVRYILEGSVQKANNRVRINVQLIDATTSGHLWAERYDRELQDIFALQDEVAQRVVAALQVQLTEGEQEHLVHKNTDNVEAYDFLLRGVTYYLRYTPEANAQARQLFEHAIELDPRYADAYAFLSATYWIEWDLQWSQNPAQSLERFTELARQALALDDSLPLPHIVMGYVYLFKDRQFEQGVAELQQAVNLAPNNADMYFVLAEGLNIAGRPAEALGPIHKAMRLNPHYLAPYPMNLGWAYRGTGQYAEAIATLKEALSRNPNSILAHLNLAVSYWLQWVAQQSPAAQTLEPAVAAGQRALALSDSYHVNHIVLGYISLYQQQYDQALAEMERAVALAPTEAVSYAALAEVLSRVGRADDALEAAAQALRLQPFNIADEHLAHVGSAYAVAGRYEEARAPLQRYLSHYPNMLSHHLMLAAVYSELGQAAEAQAEAAAVLRLNPQFSLEVHKQRVPIKDLAVLERQIAALRKAGLK